MSKVCVLIRVYNRVEDLKYCVSIIRDTWKSNSYYLLVVFNGGEAGFVIDKDTLNQIDSLVEIPKNTGHFSGNSQLLLKGLQHIPADCDYTIILEADTWLYGDSLIKKYIARLKAQNAVWASAQFFRYVRNLATDFAIVQTSFVKANPQIFSFAQTPEYYVANYLWDNGYGFIYIREAMPINLPRYIRHYPFAPTGRFFMFPAAKMVTHHSEVLKNGMEEKKADFNLVAQKRYFDLDAATPVLTRLLLTISVAFTALLPYASWFIKNKKLPS